jgi:hypothetical protein
LGGKKPWIVQTNSVSLGKFAARAGAITNAQFSFLTLSMNTPAGIGAFDLKVSSEPNWDRLQFYLNGELNQQWSGEVGWETYQFILPAGTNLLEWRYVKDAFASAGLDAAFLDNVDLPAKPVTVGVQSLAPAGGLRLELRGQANHSYVLQASADLVHWTSVSTNLCLGGTIPFTVPDTGRQAAQFYRAQLQ